MIVHCIAKALFRSQVTLCRLDRDVAKQELDLPQLATGVVTQLRAGSPEIMGRNSRETGIGRRVFDNGPDHFGCEARTPNTACLVDRSK